MPAVNPLFARLTKNARWPSLRVTLLLIIGLSLVSTLLTAYWLSSTENLLATEAAARQAQGGTLTVQAMTWDVNPLPPFLGTFLVLPSMFLVLTPITVIVVAAIMTANEVKDTGAYQLLNLALPSRAIVHGLMLAVVYRMRILLILTFVLMPFLIIKPYQKAQAVTRYGGCYMFVTPDQWDSLNWMARSSWDFDFNIQCADVPDVRLFWEAAYKALKPAIISWGISLLGLALAIGLTLWWRRVLPVLLFFAGIPLIFAALSLSWRPMPGLRTSACTNTCMYFIVWPPRITDLLLLPVPYVLAWGCVLLARRGTMKVIRSSR